MQQTVEATKLDLTKLKSLITAKPFTPHKLFRNGHAQTIANQVWLRRRQRLLNSARSDEARLFRVESNAEVLVHCRWQEHRNRHPTMLLVHGLEGSSESIYMLGTGHKAFAAGFNVLRMNMRNCGGTEHLTTTLYNSGMTADIEAVINELILHDSLQQIFLVGFSMSGNMILRVVGEGGAELPTGIRAACAVSPAVDLAACAAMLETKSNWIYRQKFVRSLRRRMRRKKELYPELYEIDELKKVRSVREFDARYTVTHGGYRDVADYYARASSLSYIKGIQRPTLIIHAQDDPFIPFDAFRDPSITSNPYIVSLLPQHGGHVGFVSENGRGEDRFWAENRVAEFCRFVHEQETAISG